MLWKRESVVDSYSLQQGHTRRRFLQKKPLLGKRDFKVQVFKP